MQPCTNHPVVFPATSLAQKEEERKQQREAARLEAARLVLAGKSILVPWGTDDPFAGMSPKVRGRRSAAPGLWRAPSAGGGGGGQFTAKFPSPAAAIAPAV